MGNAVFVVGVGSDGYVKKIFDLNLNPIDIVDESREEKKPMIGASLTNGKREKPYRYVPDENGDWQAQPVNFDNGLPEPTDAPVVLLAPIDDQGNIGRAIRLSDFKVMTNLIGERLASNTDPCCWVRIGGVDICKPCFP